MYCSFIFSRSIEPSSVFSGGEDQQESFSSEQNESTENTTTSENNEADETVYSEPYAEEIVNEPIDQEEIATKTEEQPTDDSSSCAIEPNNDEDASSDLDRV